MDLDVRCPRKALKFNHSLTHYIELIEFSNSFIDVHKEYKLKWWNSDYA